LRRARSGSHEPAPGVRPGENGRPCAGCAGAVRARRRAAGVPALRHAGTPAASWPR
jgi:hypothetical protein